MSVFRVVASQLDVARRFLQVEQQVGRQAAPPTVS